MTNSVALDGTETMEVERNGFRQRVPVGSMGTYVARQAAYQAVAYAASLTIDPAAGAVVQVGALTGDLAIAAPRGPVAGDVLRLCFVQDGAGGHAVTFNAAFDADAVAAQPIVATAGKRSGATFTFSGGVWQ